jgi:hypothetical protein
LNPELLSWRCCKALASNQNPVELTKAERWSGVLPTSMLPNTALPFVEAR